MRVGLLWRREWDPPAGEPPKLHGVFAAFEELGVEAEPVVYSDDAVDAVREQVLQLDGVLVWVNPIEKGLDRSKLDPLLREAVAAGVFVGADPDVILRMGTKEVLVDTWSMSWGTDTHIYRTFDAFRDQLPVRIAAGEPIVLKQHRGMGGAGVWNFLYGPKDDGGNDTYVLCEINVSSTFAFPEVAMPGVARATIERLRER